MEETGYSADGLSRTMQVVIPAAESSGKMDQYLLEASKEINLKGFRPGKVPLNILRNRFGRQVAGEILKELVKEHSEKAIEEKEGKGHTQPEIVVPENAVDTLLANQDVKFAIKYEVAPEIEIGDLSDIEVELPLVKIDESKVEAVLKDLAGQNQTFEPRNPGEISENGDQVEISLMAKGEDSTEANAEKMNLVLGSSNLFGSEEEKLVGAKVGDIRELSILLPNPAPTEQDEEKRVHYSATILSVSKPAESKIDDEFAKNLGMESLEQLKEQISATGNKEFEQTARAYKIMQIQKKFLEKLDFPVSEKMVELEFEFLWHEFSNKQKTENRSATDSERSEQENKERIKKQAERQVRLFHIYSAIASKHNIEVSSEDVEQTIQGIAGSGTVQIDQEKLKALKEDKNVIARVQSNILEQKVLEYLASNVRSTNRTMSQEELQAAIEKCAAEIESIDFNFKQKSTN